MNAVRPTFISPGLAAYSLARMAHERWGVTSSGVGMNPPQLVERSRLFQLHHVDNVRSDAQVVDALLALAKADASLPRALFTDHDWFTHQVARNADELGEGYLLPSPSEAVLDRVTDKLEFQAVCASLGIPHPETVVVDLSVEEEPSHLDDLVYPVVAKPASSTAYLAAQFDGKRKVYHAADRAALDEVLAVLRAGGFQGQFMVQEFVPGDDTAARLVTVYVDSSGELTLAATARVLAEEHAARTSGLALAVLNDPDEQLIEYARAFLAEVGYRGFGSFDVKVDARTGEPKFFELNPRTGRSSYFAAAAGANIVEIMADDLVGGISRSLTVPQERVVYSVLPRPLLRRTVGADADAWAVEAVRSARLVNPWKYRADRAPDRLAYLAMTEANHYRKALRGN